MTLEETEKEVKALVDQGQSIDYIIDVLAKKKCFHSLLKIAFAKNKLIGDDELELKLRSHKYYSKEVKEKNPFINSFINHMKKDNDRSSNEDEPN